MAACAAALDPVKADAYLPALEQFYSIISHLRSTGPMTHSELEQFLNVDGREMLRRIFQGYLDERGPGAVAEPVVDADGQEHTHQRLHSRSLTTIFGEVDVNRQGYGGRGLESLHPLDAELNLPPESYSHRVRLFWNDGKTPENEAFSQNRRPHTSYFAGDMTPANRYEVYFLCYLKLSRHRNPDFQGFP